MKNFLTILPVVVVAAMFVAGLFVYPYLPPKIASHWDAAGNVNGYMSKFWGVFLFPIISLGMLVLFWLVPRIDPKRANIETFMQDFRKFIAIFFFFFGYLYALTLWWNLGGPFEIVRFLVPAFAALFYSIGVLVSKARPNWTIGIRTPWTLENEVVWNKTHKLGARIFKIIAACSLLGMIFPKFAFALVITLVVGSTLYLVIYSYLEFQRQQKISGR